MPAKKKKTKATSNTARGFATVSTASKAKVAEAEQSETTNEQDAKSTTQETAVSKDTAAVQPAETSDSQGIENLTPEELEARLEEHELQVLVDKYGDQVKKDVLRQVNRLRTDKRLLRGQSDAINTRPWLNQEILDEVFLQHERDIHDAALSTNSRTSEPSTTSGIDGSSVVLDEYLLSLWILKAVLNQLGFLDRDVDRALKHVVGSSALNTNLRSTKHAGNLLDQVLVWLAQVGEKHALPNYNQSMSALAAPSKDHVKDPDSSIDNNGSLDGLEAADGSLQRQNAGRPSEKPSHEPTSVNGKQPSLESKTAISSEKHTETDDADTSEPESDVSLVDGDDPRAQQKYLTLMTRLHKRRPDLTDIAGAKKKGKQHNKKPSAAGETPTVRRLRAKIASFENDILFDADMAKAIWAEQRIDLLRDEAQRKRHGVSQSGAPSTAAPSSTAEDLPFSKSSDEENDMMGLGDMLGDVPDEASGPSNETTEASETGRSIVVREFGKWTGAGPRRLLEEVCKNHDGNSKVAFSAVAHHGLSKRHAVTIHWGQQQEISPHCPVSGVSVTSSSRHVKFTMDGVSTPDTSQSEAYIAVIALFSIFGAPNKDDRVFMRLPTVWREFWNELKMLHKEQMDALDRAELRALRELAEAGIRDSSTNHNAVEPKGGLAGAQIQTAPTQTTDKDGSQPQAGSRTHANNDPEKLKNLWQNKTSTPAFAEMQKSRAQLPMWRYKDELLSAINSNQVVIVCGETGCGKSTQTPSFILEHELSQGKQCHIMCTEPRRISAVSLARRVSQELGEPRNALDSLHSLIGYAIRLDSKVGSMSRLVFATTGVMMRRLEHDRELNDVTHLIIDEVHERTIDSDFLLIVLRRILPRRPNLKVILMSATVNADRFSDYFEGAPIFNVPGRTFPVEIKYLEDAIEATQYSHPQRNGKNAPFDREQDDQMSDDMSPAEGTISAELSGYSTATRNVLKDYNEYRINYDLILALLQHIATSKNFADYSKAVLVFLPGLAEIRRMRDMLSGHALFEHNFQIHALHSAIATEEQERAFLIPPRGMRKIVLSTNIAETGVTIPDVTCVIDTGTHKEMRYDERRQLSRLTEVFISRANAKQRRGRAGRVQNGLCFHLFTQARHDKLMIPQQTPEIMRLSLQELVLRVKTCNMGGVEETLAAALDPPLPKNVRRAIDALVDVKALTNGEELTPLGRQLAKLPLDVFLGKLVLLGSIFNCVDSTLTIAAILSNKSPFSAPMNAREQADRARMAFKKGDSDLLTVYSAYCSWRHVCKTPGVMEQDFLRKNYLNSQTLMSIEETKGQLAGVLADTGFLKADDEFRASLGRLRNPRVRNFVEIPKQYTENDSRDIVVNSVIAWSLYPKLLVREGKGWRSAANNQTVSLSPTSVNKGSSAGRYLSFYHIMQSMNKAYNAHETSVAEDFAVALLCGDAEFRFYSGFLGIDNNRLKFALPDWKTLLAIKVLRENVRGVMNQRFKAPQKALTESQAAWLRIWQKLFQGRADS